MNTGRKTIKGTSPKIGTGGFWERGFWKVGTCSFFSKRNTLLDTFGEYRTQNTFGGPKNAKAVLVVLTVF
jgi:hypothetical protein